MAIIVDDVYVDETRPLAHFTVRLTSASSVPVSVSYNNSNETALNGSDYVAQSGTLTFAPGQTVLTIDIPLIGNATFEPIESFRLNLFNAVNSTIATPFARATIFDNDAPSGTPTMRVSDTVVDEASGQVSFVVTLSKPSTGTVSVNYATADGTAKAGSDYVGQSTHTLSFAPGEMVKVVNVGLINDTLAEGREFFDLRLASPVGATLLPQPTGRAFIGASDQAAQALPLVSASNAVADESRTYLDFVVSLNAPSTQTVSVSYNNSNVTALNGSDYLAQSSVLTFLPGETTKVVKIPLLDTAGAEPTEVLALNLFNAVNATIARPLAYGSLYDNDATSGTPVVRVADQVVDEASGQVAFVVTLDRPSTGNVSVNAATVNGTAVAGSDFVAPATQTLTFTPGEMVKVVNVDLINDTTAESAEFFDLRLSSPIGATLLPQPNGRAFIGANDQAAQALPLISASDAVADESRTFIEFVVSLSAPSAQKISVSYNNSNVTALNGSDYLAQSSVLTFAPGETTQVVKIPVLNTAGAEPAELLALNLFNPVNATIARPLAYGSLVDNDQTSGTPVIRVADQIVDEAAGQVGFVVALDRPSTGKVSVNVATANGTAASGSDYQALPTQTLTFTPGEMTKLVTVGLLNDATNEPGEYFDLKLSSPVGASLPDTGARAFIAPSDAPAASLPRISVADAAAGEGDIALSFVVSLSAPSTQTVKVSYNNSNVSALNGSDYLAQSSVLTFAPGETTKLVTIPVLDGLVAEPTELLNLNLFNAVNATIARPFAQGTIYDNDPTSGTPSLAVSDGIVDEGEARAAFTITLDKPSTSQVTVGYATASGTAGGGSDYESQSTQTLVFGPGEVSKTVYVDLRNDTSAEPAEFFDMTLSSAVNATIGDSRGHMVITQSDLSTVSLPVIAATSIAAPEAGTWLEFQVSLSAPSAQTVSVAYNNSNATALNGSDYLAQSSTITFAPGETLHTLRIPVLNDLTVESTETFKLNLFNAVNATIGTSSVTGSILDNDGPPLASQFVNVGTNDADVLVGRPGANSVSGGAGNDVLDGVNGVAMSGGSGNDLYLVESSSDTVNEASGAGTDTVASYVSHTLAANVENLLLLGSAVSGTGNTLANTITGNGGANTLSGGAGSDTLNGKGGADSLSGGADADTFVFDNLTGSDTITDWSSAADTLRFGMSGIKVGDGDALVENAAMRSAPGGFSTAAELVVFTNHIAGAITTASAAAAIGSSTSAYAAGANVLFAVDNGTQSGVFLFHSAAADATVSAAELTQVALLNGGFTSLGDYVFSP